MYLMCQRFGHDYSPPKWTGDSRKSPVRGIIYKKIQECRRCGKEKEVWKNQVDRDKG